MSLFEGPNINSGDRLDPINDINPVFSIYNKDVPITAITPQIENAKIAIENLLELEKDNLGEVRNPAQSANSQFIALVSLLNPQRLSPEIQEKTAEVLAAQLIDGEAPLAFGEFNITSTHDSFNAIDPETWQQYKDLVADQLNNQDLITAYGPKIIEHTKIVLDNKLESLRERDIEESKLLVVNSKAFQELMNIIKISDKKQETTIEIIKNNFRDTLTTEVDTIINELSYFPDINPAVHRRLLDLLNQKVSEVYTSLSYTGYIPSVISPNIDEITLKAEVAKNSFNRDTIEEHLTKDEERAVVGGFVDRINSITSGDFLFKNDLDNLDRNLDLLTDHYKSMFDNLHLFGNNPDSHLPTREDISYSDRDVQNTLSSLNFYSDFLKNLLSKQFVSDEQRQNIDKHFKQIETSRFMLFSLNPAIDQPIFPDVAESPDL